MHDVSNGIAACLWQLHREAAEGGLQEVNAVGVHSGCIYVFRTEASYAACARHATADLAVDKHSAQQRMWWFDVPLCARFYASNGAGLHAVP